MTAVGKSCPIERERDLEHWVLKLTQTRRRAPASNARASSPLCAAYFSEDAGFHRVAGRSDRCCRGRRFLKCSAVVAPPCHLGSRYVLQNVVMRTIGMNEFLNWCGLSKDVPQSRSSGDLGAAESRGQPQVFQLFGFS